VKNPSLNDKVIIGKKYLLKELCPNIGIDIDKILITDDTVKFIITKYCKDDVGLRGLKKCIESILLKINSALYNPMIKYKTLKNISLEEPFEITVSVVEDVLKKNEDKYSELMNSMFL
jgi:ATP-dependent Lon protease